MPDTPTPPPAPSRRDAATTIDDLLPTVRRIAVVGLSGDRSRASHGVASALRDRGYEIVPVNPTIDDWEGIPAVDSLADVAGEIDLVDVFRRPEHLPGIAREAAEIGSPALWNQLGLRSDEARAIAAAAGMTYVEDHCLKVEVQRRDTRPPVA